jgi:hypothetical protein
MRKLVNLICCLCLTIPVFGQSPLPTSYNFDNFSGSASLPTGWTTNIAGTFVYAVGVTGAAGKIDQLNEFIQIQTADPIGTATYYLKGWIGGGPTSWAGTFKVQESINGNNWTDLASYTTLNSSTYNQYTVSPANASRYIKFILTAKTTGCNVGIDDVSLTLGSVPNAEINVKQGNQSLFSGDAATPLASPVGTPANSTFTIENLGSAEQLSVTNIQFSGAGSADFSVVSPGTAFTVAPTSNQPLVIAFNPSVAGNRYAAMTISNNDANESSYVINLNFVGGAFATEPTNQPSALNFTGVKSYRMGGSFTASSADGYLVLRKKGSAVTDVPVDGVSYNKGQGIGSSKVFSTSTSSTFNVNEVEENTDYSFAVFAYNGSGTVINYLQSNPLTGSITSAASSFSSEYTGINATASSFIDDLHALINTHQSIFYGNYDETMLRLFEARDTSNSQRVVTCIYSGLQFIYSEPFNWDVMSREHTYCHAWMPTNPADNPEKPEYNDQHHLFPAQFADVNQVRLDWPLGVVSTVVSTYLDSKFGLNASGKTVFEPRDAHKGDAARALMYMCVAYNSVSGNNWHLPQSSNKYQDQNLLRKWHYQDPPSSYEKARNDFLDSLQGNRNPFIDHPEYACYIDFSNMTYLNAPAVPCAQTSVGNEELNNGKGITVLPNPSTGLFTLFMNDVSSEMNLEIYDVSGKIVARQFVNAGAANIPVQIDLSNFTKGVYILRATGKGVQFHSRLMVQ